MADTQSLKTTAAQVRRDIVRMVTGANSGHPGGSLGATDILTALYFQVMHLCPENFCLFGAGEDLFYLSNGHISPALYSVLARRGYFPVSELGTFRCLGSRLQGHPSTDHGLPGVRVATGSLGQGVSCAIGHALAKRLDGDSERRVFVLMGDGELEEGQIWEAALFAQAHRVDNLVGIVDWNNQQIDGTCEQVAGLTNLRQKFEAFGWEVMEMNGNDMAAVVDGLSYAKTDLCGHGKPVVILAKTVMGRGVDYMEGTHEWHGKAPSLELCERALAQLQATALGDY